MKPASEHTAPESPEAIARKLRQAVGGDRPLWVDIASGSMRPLIERGDRARIAAADRPRWGEVWAYCHQTGFVMVHRCRGRPRTRRGFLFQGDAEHRSSAMVPPDRLIGRVVAVEHGRSSRRLGGWDRWRRGLPRQIPYKVRRVTRRLSRRPGR